MSTDTKQTDMTDAEESIPLDESGEVRLPIVEILTGRGFITGKSGSGKSNSASVLVEELLDRGFPVMIVDTDGEYWGLKEQYEILHVGADEECDLQVGPEHADKLASLALEDNVPIILDVSGYLEQEEANAVVREVASALYTTEKKLNKPFLLLVEECHEYIPEGGGLDETGDMLVRIGKRGRKRGLGLCGISQRPADVKKDFITQCDWILWHRLTWDNDTDVVRRVLDSAHADGVQDLGDGEGYLMSDFLDEDVLTVQVRRKRTFDAGATPDLGEFERPDLKSVSGDLVDELEDISEQEERRQDRIAELEAELEQKEARIEDLERQLEQAQDVSSAANQFVTQLQEAVSGDVDADVPENFEAQLAEKNEEIRDLQAEIETLEEREADLLEERDRLQAEVERLQSIEERVDQAERIEEQLAEVREIVGVEATAPATETDGDVDRLRERVDELEKENERLRAQAEVEIDETIGAYEDFLTLDVVEQEIDAAKEETSQRYVKGVMAAIINEGGPVSYDLIAERLGLGGTSHISRAATELESRKIITKESRDGGTYVDLNADGIDSTRERWGQLHTLFLCNKVVLSVGDPD